MLSLSSSSSIKVVASCAQTMGMHIIGYDPVMTPDAFLEVRTFATFCPVSAYHLVVWSLRLSPCLLNFPFPFLFFPSPSRPVCVCVCVCVCVRLLSSSSLQIGIERADLEDIWAKSDFITVHTPLTPETSNLIGKYTTARCCAAPCYSAPYCTVLYWTVQYCSAIFDRGLCWALSSTLHSTALQFLHCVLLIITITIIITNIYYYYYSHRLHRHRL